MTTIIHLPFFIALAIFSGCNQPVKTIETQDTAQVVNSELSKPLKDEVEAPPVQLPKKIVKPVVLRIEDLSLKRIGELILRDSLKSLENEEITFMLLDSLSAESSESRNFYFRVFNKIMDRLGGALSDVIGEYALRYIEAYPNEFLLNSKNFTAERMETWASQIGIELFLSSGEPRDAFEKTTENFKNNCKDCGVTEIARLAVFNKMVWTTIQQNIEEKHP